MRNTAHLIACATCLGATGIAIAQPLSSGETIGRLGEPSLVGLAEFVRRQHNDVWVTDSVLNYKVLLDAQKNARGITQIDRDIEIDDALKKSKRFYKMQSGMVVGVRDRQSWNPDMPESKSYQVEILLGKYKGRKFWTLNVRDLKPSIGESLFLLSNSGAKSVAYGFRPFTLIEYFRSTGNGDKSNKLRLERQGHVLRIPNGSKVTLLEWENFGDEILLKVDLEYVPQKNYKFPKSGWISTRDYTFVPPKWFYDWRRGVRLTGSFKPVE